MNDLHNFGSIAIGVDIQNDFCPGGSLAVPFGDEVVKPFNKIGQITRKNGGLVIFTRDWHPKKTSHFNNWPPHCIAGTKGAEFHRDLIVEPQDIIVSKGMGVDENAYSGFDGITENGESLKDIIYKESNKFQKIVILVGGLATDYCVKATVLDALEVSKQLGSKSLGVIALRHCMRAVNINPDDGDKAMQDMRLAGVMYGDPIGAM